MNTLFREQRLGRIIADLSALIYSNLQPVALDAAPGFYASPSEADGAVFAPFGVQETWGGRNSYTWFRGLTAAPVCGQDERPCCSWTPWTPRVWKRRECNPMSRGRKAAGT